MTAAEPYNDIVRACFKNPGHAGDLQGTYAKSIVADVSESDSGARVVLSIGVSGGMIAEMRFRARACPHLIAAAEIICNDREDRPVALLQEFDVNTLMRQLSVPVEKTGKLLLLEDALKSLWEQHDSAP